MGGSRKSKKVTWASDLNLCQVRLFLAEECPSEVGMGAQEHLQTKVLWPVQSGGMECNNNLPPGFEAIQPASPGRVNVSQIPLVKWKCPARFEVNRSWQVVAGEESKETEAQNQREIRTLEAIYPRPSAIPPNPSASMGVEDSFNNDQNTPLVPITPIEDEDVAPDASFASMPANSSTQAAPLNSGISNNEPGNLIDHNLLIKILSNPQMIEQLVTNQGAFSSTQHMPTPHMPSMPFSSHQNRPATALPHVASSSTQNMSFSSMHNMPSTSTQYTPNLKPMITRLSASITRPQLITPSVPTTPPPFYPHISVPVPYAGVTKDLNYYKSLIQQHGGERREILPQFAHHSQEPLNVTYLRDSKPKPTKPCVYFNSSRGCRNGANCTYQHHISTQQSAKRVKLSREITGA